MTARVLGVVVALASVAAAGGCGRTQCRSPEHAQDRRLEEEARERRALEAELSRRHLVPLTPQAISGDGSYVAPEWAVRAIPEALGTERQVLMSGGEPPPLVKDEGGKLHAIRFTGAVAQEVVTLCGCDPGQGMEQRPPVWVVELPSPDAFGAPIDIALARTVIVTRYERDTGAPGECHSAP